MCKSILFLLCLLGLNLAICQKGQIIQNKAISFQLPLNGDTIEFIVVDKTLSKKKPIFLWCQGSLPQPLFGEYYDQNNQWSYHFQGGGIANFNYAKIVEKYHLVVISMPKTPLVVSREYLNNQFLYVPDKSNPETLSNEYLEADYLDNYVTRGNEVIRFLSKQDWATTEGLVVAGASQGSIVATKIATSNPLVTRIGLFSTNPFGRIDQLIREARFDAHLGKTSWEKADSTIQDQYDFFKKAHNPDSIKNDPGLKAWKTFSEPIYDDWLSLKIPIYLCYGTEDRVADLCDIIPIFFIAANKDNLTMKRHLYLEHNFFEVDENGNTNYQKPHWNDVMMDFLNWMK